MPQKHADGHILNDRGERDGRWDDNVHGIRQWAISHNEDPDKAEETWRRSGQSHRPVVRRVEGYYEANKHRADRNHGENWLRVLNAFGQYQERGIKPYSAAEARESAKVWRGWEEVALALEGLESTNFEFAHGYDPAGGAYAQDGTDGYVAPDDERWGNERQAEDDNASQIASEHVNRFCEYLERERALVAKECGSQHPAIKCGTYEAYIEDVRSGERVHSQIMFNYEQFLGWLRGEYPQRTADETSLWADGREDDHTAAMGRDAEDDDDHSPPVGPGEPLEVVSTDHGHDTVGVDQESFNGLPVWNRRMFTEYAEQHPGDSFNRDFSYKWRNEGRPELKHNGKVVAYGVSLLNNFAHLPIWSEARCDYFFQVEHGQRQWHANWLDFSATVRGILHPRTKEPVALCDVYYGMIEGERKPTHYAETLGKTVVDLKIQIVGEDAADKAKEDAYAEQVRQFQLLRDNGDPDAQQGFDEWKRENRAMFPWNGTYVMDARSECFINSDHVARRRDELTAENVRYRLDCDRPDGIRQISWLALNYEGCLCWLPEYDREKTEKTRMVPAEEIPDLIAAGWRVLTPEEYAENQRTKHSRTDRFAAFRLYVQYDSQGIPLGVCPTQSDSTSGGDWQYNRELFAAMQGGPMNDPVLVGKAKRQSLQSRLAAAYKRHDWAEVARLAQELAR